MTFINSLPQITSAAQAASLRVCEKRKLRIEVYGCKTFDECWEAEYNANYDCFSNDLISKWNWIKNQ